MIRVDSDVSHKKEMTLKEALCQYELTCMSLASLTKVKYELEILIAKMFRHEGLGQQTYRYDEFDVVISIPSYYKVNPEIYEQLKSRFKDTENPVIEKKTYDVDKRKFKDLMRSADKDLVYDLQEFISVTAGKTSVQLKNRGGA